MDDEGDITPSGSGSTNKTLAVLGIIIGSLGLILAITALILYATVEPLPKPHLRKESLTAVTTSGGQSFTPKAFYYYEVIPTASAKYIIAKGGKEGAPFVVHNKGSVTLEVWSGTPNQISDSMPAGAVREFVVVDGSVIPTYFK